jgi:hypothetical protein
LDTFATAERNPKCPKPEPKSLVSWLHSLLRLWPKVSVPSASSWAHSPWLIKTLKILQIGIKTALHPTPPHNPTSLMSTCSRNAKLRPFASNTNANQLICKP